MNRLTSPEPPNKKKPLPEGSSRFLTNQGKCIQEWTGKAWKIVDDKGCAPGCECRVLKITEVIGQHVGQRVLTPCHPRVTRRPKP
jgi:hypothetical protein